MLKDIVNRNLVTVEPHQSVLDAVRLMESKNVGTVLILSNGKPRGIITDRDIVVRCIAKNLDVKDTTVENVMTESLEICNENEGFFDCIQKMRKAGVRRIPVVDQQSKAIGVISYSDLLAVLSKEFVALAEAATPLEERVKESGPGRAA